MTKITYGMIVTGGWFTVMTGSISIIRTGSRTRPKKSTRPTSIITTDGGPLSRREHPRRVGESASRQEADVTGFFHIANRQATVAL
jgi:hypothetical protein